MKSIAIGAGIWFLFFLLVGLSCSNPSQQNIVDPITIDLTDPIVQKIYSLQDRRDAKSLHEYAYSENPSYRFLAAQAMASVQSLDNNADLAKMAKDPYQAIREEAVFALGQSYRQNAVRPIQEVMNMETDPAVLAKSYEAIGKCGGPDELNELLSLDHFADNQLNYGLALGIYRFALRNIVSQISITRMTMFLDSTFNDETRRISANYLARLTGVDLMDQLDAITNRLLQDKDPVVRSNMAIALNKTNSSRARTALIMALEKDEDYRVRVNALRSLVYFDYNEVSDHVYKALNDPHIQVRITASEFFLLITMRKDATKYALYASKMEDWLPKANLLKAALKFAEPELELKINSFLKNKAKTEANPYAKAAYVEALSGDIKNYQLLANIAFSAEKEVVTTAAMQGLNRMRISEEFSEQIHKARLNPEQIEKDFLQIYKNGISSGETTLTAVAAIALRNPELNFKDQVDDLEFLTSAQANLILPREMETYLELQKTLNFFEEKENETPAETPFNNPIDWAHVESILGHDKARVTTTKGVMTVELKILEAPGTVSNFVKLVQEDFYDSLSFHRVVPNFVAQGGCPRGDGYGSTETSIRSEFANHYFQEGSFGVASSGKDTESCQWFVCHFPTFHLDGGYTNFATVIEGLEVAHNLEIGDLILDIELL